MAAVQTPESTGFGGNVHLPGTETATFVTTPQLKQVVQGMTTLAKHGGVLLLDGPPGLGKTAAAKTIGQKLNMDKCFLAMPNKPRGKETTARISQALTGQRPNMRVTEYEMLEDILDLLQGRTVALAIDEAQHLNEASFRQLRWLHDADQTKLLLIFVGVNVSGVMQRSCAELANRVRQTVRFNRYSRAEMTQFLRQYHPLYSNTDKDVYPQLLNTVDGNLRNAATLLSAALDLGMDPNDGLDPAGIQAATYAVRGD